MGFDVPMDRNAAPASAGSVHMDLPRHEADLVGAYRNASDDTQIAVCAVLGLKRDILSETGGSAAG